MLKRLKKGFSTAEVLIVVAIIALLGAIGTVATVNYLRTMHQLEMDGVAKEIFVAAQNHLSAAGAEGYLERTDFGTPEDESVNGEKGVYYFITGASGGADPDSKESSLGLMLPFASIDETVRKGGSYIVRYHKESAQVLDVFYSNAEGKRYGHNYTAEEYATLIKDYRADTRACKDKRRDYSGAILGYYGGVQATDFEFEDTFLAPNVSVINSDRLTVNITNPNPITKSGFTLRLLITGKTSGASKYVTLVDSGSVVSKYSADDGAGALFNVVLDDVTSGTDHFAQLLGTDTSTAASGFIGGALIPGEDFEVKAIALSNAINVAPVESAKRTGNSLFASASDVASGEAVIGNIRHLENLSKSLSALGQNGEEGKEITILSATQNASLSWPDFKSSVSSGSPDSVRVYAADGTAASPAGSFAPVTFDGELDYDGDGNSVTGVTVKANADAGLFGSVTGGEIKNLELVDFDISTTSGNAGALAGTVNGAMIKGVVARNDNISDDSALSVSGTGAVGGLIGDATGASVSVSAAAVYVSSSAGPAGGLVGSMTSSSYITNSYAGGHTVEGMYLDDTAAGVKGRVNVVGTTAGGLVGSLTGSSVSYSYSTASAKGDSAGGLIGGGSSVTVSGSYSTGKVSGNDDTSVVGAFLGSVSSVTSSSGNKYFGIINEGVAPVGSGAYATGISELDDTLTTYNENVVTDTAAYAYDPYLVFEFKGASDMAGIAELHGAAVNTDDWPEFFKNSAGTESVHYGDWPSPETKIVNPDSLIATVANRSSANFGAVRLNYGEDAAIPEDAELSVTDPEGDLSEYRQAVAALTDGHATFADISIISGGREIQPSAPVTVAIQLPAGSSECKVVHFGEKPELLDVTVAGGVATFETRSFSVYAVVDGVPARRTYAFYSPDQLGNYSPYDFYTNDGEWVNEQIIKTGEQLIIPQLPSIDGSDTSTFAGWYEYDEATETYADAPYDFNNVPPVTEDERVILRAKFANFAYVIFHEQYNGATSSWPVTATRRGEMSGSPATASVEIADVTVTYDDESQSEENSAPEMAFRGWSRTKVTAGASADQNGDPIVLQPSPLTISGNTDLYPVFVHINWLSYISGVAGSGATYVQPKSYYVDEGENSFKVPTLTGYVFDGWYTGEPVYTTEIENDKPVRKMTGINYGTQVTSGSGQLVLSGSISGDSYVADGDLYVQGGKLMLREDVTLYAKWHEGTTNYNVVIWQQKATDAAGLAAGQKQYDFYSSEQRSATTGSVVNATNADINKRFTGFQLGKYDRDVTVKGDGSSVINVYYDRIAYTLTFRDGRTVKTITELYQHSISDYFPIVGTNGKTYNQGQRWEPQSSNTFKQVLVYIDVMPAENVTFKLNTSTASMKTMNFFVEALSSETPTTTRNGVGYVLYKTIDAKYNFFTEDEDFVEFTGLTKNGSNPAFDSNGHISSSPANFYYLRTGYNIEFRNSFGNALIDTRTIKFGEKIAGNVPTSPTPPTGYTFTGWYADPGCSVRVFFTQEDYDSSTAANKVLYETMPANNFQLYAGWETEWYLIEIDPNGGQFAEGYSTWFWEPFNGDPIEEYTRTRRDYIESINGTYYYHLFNRDHYGYSKEYLEDEAEDRSAYYTDDMNDATDLSTAYEYSKDAFRYAGWFEVKEDGSETLYKFGEPVMHNTLLRLHWKQVGTYYIRYDAAEGTMDDADSNEETFKLLDSADYSDHSDVVVTRTAHAPQGKNFIGWYIRGASEDELYYPGQNFEFQSKYAITETDPETGKEKKYLYMVAKYSEIAAAEITYDANGGWLEGAVDYGAPTNPDAPEVIKSQSGTTATIAHLVSNSGIRLSDGTGFANNNDLIFTGWNTKPDASGEHFDAGAEYCVDSNDPTTLYAEWQVRVYFDKNNAKATWGTPWDEPTYHWDAARQQYYTLTYVNRTVPEPPGVPISSDIMERFAYWSPVRYTDSSDIAYEFDFSTPITETTTLFGFWANAIQVDYYLVDYSGETPVDRSDEWRNPDPGFFLVNTGTNIPMSASTTGYWNVPSEYKFAMVTLAETMEGISESNIITNIGYNTVGKCVNVTYANGTVEDLPSTLKVYVVYYKDPITVPIGYTKMNGDGTMSGVTVNAVAPTEAVVSGAYDMTAAVTSPLAWANNANFKYYAFALGEKNATGADGLRLITEAKANDGSRPPMQIRNTWHGVEYSTDGGASWTLYGNDIQLYVIYFESQPTIVNINEVTKGTEADEAEQFTYTVQIIERTTTTVQQQTRSDSDYWGYPSDADMNGIAWSNVGDATTSSTETSNTTTTFELSNGQSQSRTLFYTDSQSESSPVSSYSRGGSGWSRTYITTQTKTVTTTKVTQEIVVTQTAKADFTTDNESDRGTKTSGYIWKYTT